MIPLRRILATFVLSLGFLHTGVAGASVTINVTEVGGNVDFSATGSLDLTGARLLGDFSDHGLGFIPGGSNWYVAPGPRGPIETYAMTSFDGPFGTSETHFNTPNSTSGDNFFIWGQSGNTAQVAVPLGYISGSAITSGMVFNSATIAGFTMIPGTYTYTIPNDTITLNIGTPIPEPEIYAMLSLGLGLMGWVGRRRKLQAA